MTKLAKNHSAVSVPAQLRRSVPIFLVGVSHLLIGLAVCFSAVYHESVSFDRLLFVVGCAALTISQLTVFVPKLRGTVPRAFNPAHPLALVAALLITPSAASLALIIAGWALCNAVFLLLTKSMPQRRDARLLAGFSGLLAVASLFAVNDPVMVTGLYGTHAVLAGVFGLIPIFDSKVHTQETAV